MFFNNRSSARADTENKSKGVSIGLLAIALKIGPKLIGTLLKAPVVGKLAKGLFGLKGVGAAGSLGLYSLIFSWEMGVSLVAFILIHEFGHLWAMKKCGIKTRGIYLIPGFGGAAVAGESFKNARNEMFIAIMGPLYGLLFIGPMLALYFITNNPIFAAIASIMALINLLNLFPINPLDGGRIVKSLLYSVSASVSFFGMILSFVVACALSVLTGFWLLAIIAFIGLGETLGNYDMKKALEKLYATVLRAILSAALFFLISYISGLEGWRFVFISIAVGILALSLFIEMVIATKKKGPIIISYPIVVVMDMFRAMREIISLRPSHLKRIDDFQKMNGRQTLRYTAIYMTTIVAMIVIVVYTGSIPGVALAKDLLR